MSPAKRHGRPATAAIALCLAITGCGDSHRYATVSGVVTFDGEPIDGVRIMFEPLVGEPGSGSTGLTDASGRYTLRRLADDRPGVRVATHRVTMTSIPINSLAHEGMQMPRERVPAKLRDGSHRVDVPIDGLDSADFALERF